MMMVTSEISIPTTEEGIPSTLTSLPLPLAPSAWSLGEGEEGREGGGEEGLLGGNLEGLEDFDLILEDGVMSEMF